MCHTEVPPGTPTPDTTSAEVQIALEAGGALPALHIVSDPGAAAVLIVGDVFGRSPFYEHLAALVAHAGFQVLVPDFFFRQGALTETTKEAAFARRGQLDEEVALRDLAQAVDWLRAHSHAERVGTVGFCMGGTFVLDLASSRSDLVTVAYYGFPVVQPTIRRPPPNPLDVVEELAGPVFALWGDSDDTVGMDHVAAYVDRASATNPEFRHEIVVGLGHGFLGSAELGNAHDSGGATWDRALDHLRTHLYPEEDD